MDKAGNFGLIEGLVVGLGTLIVSVILIFVVVGTIQDADLLGADATTTLTITNETSGYINATGYTLALVNSSNSGYAITSIYNASQADGTLISTGNYTISSAGVLTNATTFNWADVNLTYTFTFSYDNDYELSSDRMAANLTEGVDRVSEKVPTVLLIAAVVLLFGVLAILVVKAKEAGMMGDSGGQSTL